jgi:nodulation protein E
MDIQFAEITGRGALSCLGATAPELTRAALSGESGIVDVSHLLTTQKFRFGAPIQQFDAAAHFDSRGRSTLDRFAQFGVVAAREAWREAGLGKADFDAHRVGVVIGSASPGSDILNDAFSRIFRGNGRPLPTTIPMAMGNATASRVASEIGAKGPVFGITSACASAAHAILLGHQFIRSGLIDVAVVGAADSSFGDGYLRGWDELRVVSPEACRPFSRGRRGLTIGEGAGVLVLERAGRAARRGAKAHGRLLGGGMTCDAGELLNPDPAGMAAAMRAALADSGVEAADVDYVNAHGTGTIANDAAEARAIREIFDNRLEALAVSSTKSQIGHCMGASGGLEAIVTLAALAEGVVPPTLNFLGVDPNCGLEPTPNAPIERRLNVALSNSFAFGGLNATLAFSRAAPED